MVLPLIHLSRPTTNGETLDIDAAGLRHIVIIFIRVMGSFTFVPFYAL